MSFRDVVKKLADQGSVEPAVYANCAECGQSKNVRILAQYGAQCLGCFEAYCVCKTRPPSFGEVGFRDTPGQVEMRKRLLANRLLDDARNGLPVPDDLVRSALQATGDLR